MDEAGCLLTGQKGVYRKKISVAIEILSDVFDRGILDREKVIEILKEKYDEYRISPFRGLAQPEDLFDKEMATLYVLGKYGMGINEDYPELFGRIFEKENKYESFIDAVLLGENDEQKRRELALEKLGSPSLASNDVARILRIMFTKVVFSFSTEDDLVNLMNQMERIFPENEKDIKSFKRFYIGFKLAEMLTTGEIRSRVEKEAMKQALVLKMGSDKLAPDDRYVATIARKVFKVPPEKLERILNVRRERGETKKREEEPGEAEKKNNSEQ